MKLTSILLLSFFGLTVFIQPSQAVRLNHQTVTMTGEEGEVHYTQDLPSKL